MSGTVKKGCVETTNKILLLDFFYFLASGNANTEIIKVTKSLYQNNIHKIR